ncbi:serine hydrolase [Geitlerinema sp. CS-897]|nr:serine hydrolase [Geitlerinema sp. CS-897]
MPNFFDRPSPSRGRNAGSAWMRRQWRTRLNDTDTPPASGRVTPLSSRRSKSGKPSLDLPPLRSAGAHLSPPPPPVRRQPQPFERPASPSPERTSHGGEFGSLPVSSPILRRQPSEPLPPLRPLQFTPPRPATSPSAKRPPATPSTSPRRSPRAVSPTPRKSERRVPHRSRRQPTSRPPLPPALRPFLYVMRLSIVGVGLSAIAGTMLSLWTPSEAELSGQSEEAIAGIEGQPVAKWSPELSLGQELTALKERLQQVAAEYPGLTPGVAIVDVATGDYVRLSDTMSFSAASTIKVPILVAFFRAVDAGTVRLDEVLTMEESHIAGGSGYMQYDAPGTRYSVLEVASSMIIDSDNTATNMLVDRLGGAKVLNEQFREWGLTETTIRNPLPDLEGTNTTTPQELAKLLGQLERGELVSMRSRDRMMRIMSQTANDALLPQGLGDGAFVAHKTGNLRSVLADAGAIDLPNGKRYLMVAIVKRPDEDDRAADLIRQMSATAYDYFAKPTSSFPEDSPVAPTVAGTQQANRVGR